MLTRPEFTRPRPQSMRPRPEARSSQIHEAEAEVSIHEAEALTHEAKTRPFLQLFATFFCILLRHFCKPHGLRKLRRVYCLMVIGDNWPPCPLTTPLIRESWCLGVTQCGNNKTFLAMVSPPWLVSPGEIRTPRTQWRRMVVSFGGMDFWGGWIFLLRFFY